MRKCVVILSGGMDSTTLLWDVVTRGMFDTFALSCDYGQRHVRELVGAVATCKKLGVPHKVVDLKLIGQELLQGSSLTTQEIEVPEGYYADESMKLTVVPNRNMIMLSLAIGYAISIGAEIVYYGAHHGDHAIYPDCRPAFVDAMRTVAKLCHFTPVEVLAPYIELDKGDIAKRGRALGMLDNGAYEMTWTCYKGLDKPCLVCGACRERIEAFQKIGVRDPLIDEGTWEHLCNR